MEITTKYDKGQKLWTIDDNKVKSFKVTGISVEVDAIDETHDAMTIKYWGETLEDSHTECDCFSTKNELLASLI